MTLWDSARRFTVRLMLVGLVMTAGCTLRSGGPPTAVSSDKAGGAATDLVLSASSAAIQLPDLPPEARRSRRVAAIHPQRRRPA